MQLSKSLWCGFVLACVSVGLRGQVPTPVSVLGHTPGDDFYLADYEDAVKYFHAAAAASDRMKMFTVGKTTQGRDIEVGVISSPANLARLDEFKKNARRLAVADDLTDAQARVLAHDSKVIVHIDGGCTRMRWRAGSTRSCWHTSCFRRRAIRRWMRFWTT